MYLNLRIKVPTIIEHIGIAIVLAYRKRRYGYTFRRIKLTQGKYAIVDAEDFEKLNRHKWFARIDKCTYYATRIENKKKIYMHRQIKPPPKGFVVDHINHKGYDNRKANLRIVAIAENNRNCRKTIKDSSSKYLGVSLCKSTNKWRAVICISGQDFHLGYFDDEIEAAKAYDEAVKKHRGEFAVLNFPQVAAEPLAKTGGEFAVLNFGKDSHENTKVQRKKCQSSYITWCLGAFVAMRQNLFQLLFDAGLF
jgi:hypothetical protein